MKKFISILLALVLTLSLVGCGQQKEEAKPETNKEEAGDAISFKAGKYTGKADGHNGSVEVEVEFSEDKIVSIEIVNSEETEHLAKVVYETIPAKIVEEQNLSVDSVAGATVTSVALKRAIADAVTQAGGNPDLLDKKAEDKKEETVELETDVVVVGGGSAGASAALSAEQAGLSVILLEKNAMIGGHTALSGGLSIVTGSKIQKDLGVTNDTPEACYEDMFINGGEKSVPELLKLYCENMGESTDWTFDYVGAEAPEQLTKLGENKIDRGLTYVGNGKGLMAAFSNKLKETKVDLRLNTEATQLIMDGKDVVGVEAKDKEGTTYKIKAKSTVLASGGYGSRKDLLPEELGNFVYYGASFSNGDGLRMGEEAGADTVNMGYVELFENGVEWMPGIAKSTYNGSMAAWDVSGILVDRNGNRVVNERGSGISIVRKQQEQEDGMLFLLMDQKTYDTFSSKIPGTGISDEMLENWLENNGSKGPIFAHGESVEEVAKVAGVDAEGLKATIEKYNSFVENGKDEDFDRPKEYLNEKIGDGPFYLVEQKPRYATTLGGLKVTTDLEVVNKDGQVINGLYAIGDTAGGVRGDDSVPGADVGWAITSGYLLGNILKTK